LSVASSKIFVKKIASERGIAVKLGCTFLCLLSFVQAKESKIALSFVFSTRRETRAIDKVCSLLLSFTSKKEEQPNKSTRKVEQGTPAYAVYTLIWGDK